MATWHQMQAQRRKGFDLRHPVDWSVVIDPPGEMTSAMCFTTCLAATEYLNRLRAKGFRNAYILPPRKNAGVL